MLDIEGDRANGHPCCYRAGNVGKEPFQSMSGGMAQNFTTIGWAPCSIMLRRSALQQPTAMPESETMPVIWPSNDDSHS